MPTHHTVNSRIATGDNEVTGPARLVVIRGDRPGRQHVLEAERTVIGRALDCELRFDLAQLSRHHAAVVREGSSYLVEDLQSSNGTFVNGTPVQEPTDLALGDKLQLGTELVLQLTLHDAVHEELVQRQRLEMLGRLGAGIAHDFNNMLGAVLSNVELLREPDDGAPLSDEEVKETLGDIKVAATRAAELSQRLVAFARGRAQGGSVVDVSQVCHEVARLVRRTFPRTVAIDTAIGPRLRITGDSLELHQVLMNLCLNARDAMGDEGQLRISAERDRDGAGESDSGRDEIVIRVQDDGEGMDEATKQRIFEPFFTTKRERGFGMGLATVHEIVTFLGGQVDVQTERGVGTTFELRFPRAAAHAHRHQTGVVPRANAQPVMPLSVLVVDDEDMVRRSTQRVLRRSGHAVQEASSGQDALELLDEREEPIDLVVLDLDMPDMSGEQVLQRLLADVPEARVIVLTGHHDDRREVALVRMGARLILHKPCTPTELLEGIAHAVSPPDDEPEGPGRPQHT